ncbi:MAG: LysR family transcriptional regulator [Oscillospiraceae bacterium]|nr:LysR family transcriptional regulator [Oscillospiraceae bacterium]
MTIRHLKIFITVADCGKMNLAAKQLYISQPSVSQAIQELESYYGVTLFDRLSQKLYITQAGKQLLPMARHAVDSFETTDSVMKNAGVHPTIRIGASVTVGTCLLHKLIPALEQRLKKAAVNVIVNNTTAIETLLLSSNLDIGIVEGIVASKELVQFPVCQDELVLVIGSDHPFWNKKHITLDMLNGQNYISREDGSATRNQYEQLLAENQIELCTKWVCSNTEAIKNTLMTGSELAILSNLLVKEEIAQGKLKALTVKNISVRRSFTLIYHKNKLLSTPMQEFISLSQQMFKPPV